MSKTYAEINEKIRNGEVVVATAEEMIDIVEQEGPKKAAEKIDVVTTGTFASMCSSGAFLNIGHSKPRIKIQKAWLNNINAYYESVEQKFSVKIDSIPTCLAQKTEPSKRWNPQMFNKRINDVRILLMI